MKGLLFIIVSVVIGISIFGSFAKNFNSQSIEIKKDSTFYKSLINKGEIALKSGDFTNAKLNFSKANKIYPTKIEGLYGLGVCAAFECRNVNSKCNVAIDFFNKVISINPKYRRAYYNRALCKARLEKTQEAIRDLDKAISLSPYDSDYYLERGKLKLKIEKKADGCSDIQKSINFGNKDAYVIQQNYCQ